MQLVLQVVKMNVATQTLPFSVSFDTGTPARSSSLKGGTSRKRSPTFRSLLPPDLPMISAACSVWLFFFSPQAPSASAARRSVIAVLIGDLLAPAGARRARPRET